MTPEFSAFCEAYERNLHAAIDAYPAEYVYGHDQVATVAPRMFAAMIRGSYNKDSRAIKATCKELGIKHTYAAIAQYWGLDK